ncbi:hypothetical protein FHN55_14760 [Streptomyces sp. NP160]|uniref:hypothetical protein n=1 Tax=Streptomyces sp. NP160 TaxID=2586637 RepID=UPI00111925DE|nr:hypothetical protein [Streptomyces sp. NP160]TNM64090.1 hypothetical protein FHN55_14760 [Streptomyces sp. NP160]
MAITWAGGPAAGAPAAGGRIGPTGVARALLLLGWAVLAATGLAVGSLPGTYSDLQQGLESGRVTEVWAEPGQAEGSTGTGYQRVEWRDGWVTRRADVMTATPGEPPLGSDVPFVGTDVALALTAVNPDVQVHRLGYRTSSSELQGWELPEWAGLLAVCLLISSVTLLAGGPEPWWATRWAWFWVSLLPGGVIAYLVLSGPLPALPRALVRRGSAWRLGGGWAFLLVAVLWWL